VANGVEFLGSGGGDGAGDALDGGEIGVESRADEGKAGKVTVDAGEGEGGGVAVGDGGSGDDIKGVDGGVGGPAEGEIGQGVETRTGTNGEGGRVGHQRTFLLDCAW
jgi:hypothetical protein